MYALWTYVMYLKITCLGFLGENEFIKECIKECVVCKGGVFRVLHLR